MSSLSRSQLPDLTSLHYRNALIQGRADSHPSGPSLVYFSHLHVFLACNALIDGLHNDYSLFFSSHCRYLYGMWRKGRPQGMTVVRLHEILIITNYSSGQLSPGSNIIVLFEKYNTAIVVQVTTEGWQLREKNEVYCYEQLADLLQQYGFPSQDALPHSLVQYINRYMIGSEIKLRLIKNSLYRYGYDKGLAILFDDSFSIISAGWHSRNQLTELGVKYSTQTEVTQEGIFKENTCTYEGANRPDAKLSRIYNNYHLSGINFRDAFYCDPSLPYFNYFDSLIASPFIKKIFNSLILNKSHQLHLYNPFMEASKEDSQIIFKDIEVFSLKIGDIQKKQPSKESIPTEKREKQVEILKMNHQEYDNGKQFEKLPQRDRLKILKKELSINLKSRATPTKINYEKVASQLETIEKSRNKSRIINMQPVNMRNFQKEKDNTKSNIYIRSLEHKEDQPIDMAVKKSTTVDIVRKEEKSVLKEEKRDRGDEKESEDNSRSKSRSRKVKIFDASKSNKSIRTIARDYSPDEQVSPFRAKMKARIFQNRTPDRQRSLIPDKSSTNFHKLSVDSSNIILSPHQQMKTSRDNKGNGSSRLFNYPVTLTKQSKLKELHKDEGDQVGKKRLVRKIVGSKENLRVKEQEFTKKEKEVHRKSLMGEQGNYVYEPITINEVVNMPYVMNSNLKKITSSSKQHKKSINDTSAPKHEKMSAFQPGNFQPISYY